ncbi:MAG: c-type cytochrome [Brucella anthropi]
MSVKQKPKATTQHRPDENFEPYEPLRRIPWPLIAFASALGLWGAATLLDTRQDIAEERVERTVANNLETGLRSEPGFTLFVARCSTCHQPDGMGVRGAIPPLAESPFVAHGPELIAKILLRGIDGPIRVNDHIFDGHMPSFASVLTDSEIGELAGYVARRFGESSQSLSARDVASLRDQATKNSSFMGGAEIAAATGLALGDQPATVQASAGSLDHEISSLVFNGRGEQWSCASCHGDLGQGKENTPRLAGLSAGYIVKQLYDFADGRRQNESMRVVANTLSDLEKQKLADYYAGLRVPSNAKPELGGDVARGEELALHGDWSRNVPSCFSCHGPSGFGVAPEFPPLAAQHAAYTASQLSAWAGGHRKNSPLGLMERLSAALSAEDRKAVADYLASLPPIPAGGSGKNFLIGERP